jgi:hypothetical protein
VADFFSDFLGMASTTFCMKFANWSLSQSGM